LLKVESIGDSIAINYWFRIQRGDPYIEPENEDSVEKYNREKK
jgi:hypothetical protein